jgi:hypothetical protein
MWMMIDYTESPGESNKKHHKEQESFVWGLGKN